VGCTRPDRRIAKRPGICPVKTDKDRYRAARQAGLLTTIPFLMAVPPIAGLLIGRYLDNRFSLQPLFTIVFMLLGFAAGVREVRLVLKKANAPDEDGDKRDRKTP
jgi:ATP synthase protein I